MNSGQQRAPTDPTRVKNFARFFKGYMNLWALVTASLPIPITAVGAIPTFKTYAWTLSTYSTLFCFLLLGFIFYSRHQLARFMFPEYFGHSKAFAVSVPVLSKIFVPLIGSAKVTWHGLIAILPVILIGGSMYCVFEYHGTLAFAIGDAKEQMKKDIKNQIQELSDSGTDKKLYADIYNRYVTVVRYTDKEILDNADPNHIPLADQLMIYYLGIFLCAGAAFILMAIKEYLQDLVGLDEMDLIRGPPEP